MTSDDAQLPFDLEGGRADRDTGMALALEHAAGDWKVQARVVIAHLAHTGREFSSDDVTAVVGLPPTGSPNAVGAIVNAAARQGLIVRVGDKLAERRARHAGRVGVWRGRAA